MVTKKISKKAVKKSKISKKEDIRVKVVPPERKLVLSEEIALDFATAVHKKFDKLVKATILFGSEAKKTAHSSSDIDIVILIDDVSINWDLELISWYRQELGKVIAQNSKAKDLHVNTIKLSTWWNDLMHGDAVVINILRYGRALIDSGGFFNPIKSLLLQGKIHSTPEAVYAALQRAPTHLARSKLAELGAVEGVYWTMVDSAQAALMVLGKLPPSPEHISGMLQKYFADNKLLRQEYVNWYREIFHLHKTISHGQLTEIKGAIIDDWQKKAEDFMLAMTRIIDKVLEEKKKNN